MCGICICWYYGKVNSAASATDFNEIPESVMKHLSDTAIESLSARGPDLQSLNFFHSNGFECGVVFSRLHVQGSVERMEEQPFVLETNGEVTSAAYRGQVSLQTPRLAQNPASVICCNGEIYNSQKIAAMHRFKIKPEESDCAVIPRLVQKKMNMTEICRELDGDFAIVAIDVEHGTVTAARDPYGIKPLYFARFYDEELESDVFYLSSELKALPKNKQPTEIRRIVPGSWEKFGRSAPDFSSEIWHSVPWLENPYIGYMSVLNNPHIVNEIVHCSFVEAVNKRLAAVSGVEIGACLSGGLDSSLVASCAAKMLSRRDPPEKLHTYSIGMQGSSDLEAARIAADFIGSIHHECVISLEECCSAIPNVIEAIETFDTTTVRASVGNWLLGKFIRKETPLVKVVLNGDGSDELLGGYLYMRLAPDAPAFFHETTRLLKDIQYFDVQRSERCMSSNGLESRSPFLDRQFVSLMRSFPTFMHLPSKKNMEKSVIRNAFHGFLPESILWRPKEAFSDGISGTGKSWYQQAGDFCTESSSGTLTESQYYKKIFDSLFPPSVFPTSLSVPYFWMPKFIENATDPSARTIKDAVNALS
jgi:asparagine synthase (glutamine-hydrolysing)